MKKAWQIQEAKNRLSEVVDRSLHDGPQVISRHGKETAVVLSVKDYLKLSRKKGDLLDFFMGSPLSGSELDLTRSQDLSRHVNL